VWGCCSEEFGSRPSVCQQEAFYRAVWHYPLMCRDARVVTMQDRAWLRTPTQHMVAHGTHVAASSPPPPPPPSYQVRPLIRLTKSLSPTPPPISL